ncbi:hypothetical protein LTS10_009928 [Elasticomyces elasticus]|nr:hypothetical protein LTS10_009928 [Elasticomyces elasticus]
MVKWPGERRKSLATALKQVLDEGPAAVPTEKAFYTLVAARLRTITAEKHSWRAIARQIPHVRTATLDDEAFLWQIKQKGRRQPVAFEDRTAEASKVLPGPQSAFKEESDSEEERREFRMLDELESKQRVGATRNKRVKQPAVRFSERMPRHGCLLVEVPLTKLELADKNLPYDRSKPGKAWFTIRRLVEGTLREHQVSWKAKREGKDWRKYMKRQTFESVEKERKKLLVNCLATYNLRVLEYHERPAELKVIWEKAAIVAVVAEGASEGNDVDAK